MSCNKSYTAVSLARRSRSRTKQVTKNRSKIIPLVSFEGLEGLMEGERIVFGMIGAPGSLKASESMEGPGGVVEPRD